MHMEKQPNITRRIVKFVIFILSAMATVLGMWDLMFYKPQIIGIWFTICMLWTLFSILTWNIIPDMEIEGQFKMWMEQLEKEATRWNNGKRPMSMDFDRQHFHDEYYKKQFTPSHAWYDYIKYIK